MNTFRALYNVHSFVVQRLDGQNASFMREFKRRFEGVCQTANVPPLPRDWSGVSLSDNLPPNAERQLGELCNWLKKENPEFESEFHL